MGDAPAIDVRALDFAYEPAGPLVLRRLNLTLAPGARCLLVGANGAGKTTLLSLLAGRHMVDDDRVRVLGRPAFSDTSLVDDVSFIGGSFKLDVDVRVDEMLAHRPGIEAERARQLLGLLDVDLAWHMNRASDGQRRRVQLLLGLLRPCAVLLLDEVTSDLDLVARARLLAFLRRESAARSSTILYATHVLDGLEEWATHIAFLDDGALRYMARLKEIVELTDLRQGGVASPLHHLVRHWLGDARGPRDS